MSSFKPIGGYFELELPPFQEGFLHADALLLNSGRAGFEYVLSVQKPSHVYLPKYTCDVMLEPLKKLDIPYTFYSVNEQLELAADIKLRQEELLVYTNYFGVKGTYAEHLSRRYKKQLILDYSQAFYASPAGQSHTFYSPRKFFGLPDGGMLYTDSRLASPLALDTSADRLAHLIIRIEAGPEAGYAAFKADDAALSGQPIKRMSNFTRRLLGSIDFDAAHKKRQQNAAYLHAALGMSNQLQLADEALDAPLCYPYLTYESGLRERLIAHKVFVATYWPNVLTWCKEDELEYRLAKDLLPLPVDQRYDKQDMQQIVELIRG